MNRLLENVIKNRFKGDLFENIINYDDVEMPVKVGDPEWEHKSDDEKNFLFRSYTIDDIKLLKYFVGEVILLSNKYSHHPVIQIHDRIVAIQLYTVDLNDVTFADVEMSKKIDEIISDLTYLTQGKG